MNRKPTRKSVDEYTDTITISSPKGGTRTYYADRKGAFKKPSGGLTKVSKPSPRRTVETRTSPRGGTTQTSYTAVPKKGRTKVTTVKKNDSNFTGRVVRKPGSTPDGVKKRMAANARIKKK